ncbi:AzlD domain-containing protein [Massilia sp. TS11]|uniref:AzlD domain-containing protein n=1 Tax=Massilia sp. TS11 TaxID=2908003 RepID=UPI001EDAB36D|nr:AzlD domain-containing protein [Massilia sp. TS11]MCG2586432.1 AzlD domain-containing protein [Massilia sp. TS11]
MSALEIWITICAMACATAITRAGFWLVGHHINLPPRVQEVLRYAPACALAAIVAPDMLGTGAQFSFSLHNAKLLAGVAAIAFYLLRRDMLQTIVFGMLSFTVLRLSLG